MFTAAVRAAVCVIGSAVRCGGGRFDSSDFRERMSVVCVCMRIYLHQRDCDREVILARVSKFELSMTRKLMRA